MLHPFKEFITYLSVVIFSCVLVSRHDHEISCFFPKSDIYIYIYIYIYLMYTYLAYENSHKNYTNMQCFGSIFLFYLCINIDQILGHTVDRRSSKINGVSFSCFFVCILASVVSNEH